MEAPKVFKLLFKQETFETTSNFQYIKDVNPYIYQTLLKRGEYVVKSDVSETIFQSFLDHWIYNKTPIINPLNVFEYDQLSQEFDRMKDLIEMFTNLVTGISSATLKNTNDKLKETIIERSKYLENIIEKDQNIFKILLQKVEVKFLSKHMKEFRDDLKFACLSRCEEDVELFTRRKVTQNDLTYALNEEEKTADLIQSNKATGDIIIPRSIKDESTQEEYVITSLYKNSFAGRSKNLKSVNFSEDSEVRYFYPKTFFNSCIETLTIPSSLIELKGDWCFHAINLKNIIMPNNSHFSYFDNKYIIGKSDEKSDNYDTLYFARRNIEEAIIPTFIKHLAPYAFNYCRKLKKIEFAQNSELISIGCYSLSETIIESIIIPSHVTSISSNAFFFCNHLKKIEFLKDSELKTIENSAFQQTYIEYLSIPSSVIDFSEKWCNGMNKLKMFHIIPNKNAYITLYKDNLVLEKSDKKSDIFDTILFANRNIKEAIIPPFIKRIKSMSFACCQRLKSIKFSNHSELVELDGFSFYSSSLKSISIPKNVKRIGDSAFSICMKLNKIDFHENSKLTTIGQTVFSFTKIKSISIPFNVTKIGSHAFTNCSSLKIVEISEKMNPKLIEKPLFNNTPIVMIMIPAKLINMNIYNN